MRTAVIVPVDVTVSTKMSKAGKPYEACDIIYKQNGEVKNKMIASFSPVFREVCGMTVGETYTISMEKNDKGYLDWLEVAAGEAPIAPVSAAAAGPMPAWDGPKASSDKDDTIRRAVALKAAVEIVAAATTAKSDLAGQMAKAAELAPIVEPYLKDGVSEDDVDKMAEEL